MKGLVVKVNTISNIFLLLVIFFSLALGSYTFLVSNKPSVLPMFAVYEGMSEDVPSSTSKKQPKKDN